MSKSGLHANISYMCAMHHTCVHLVTFTITLSFYLIPSDNLIFLTWSPSTFWLSVRSSSSSSNGPLNFTRVVT